MFIFIYFIDKNRQTSSDSDKRLSSLKRSSNDNNEQPFANISLYSVILLVIFMITALLLLYFFYKYLVYFILALFLITSMTSMFICLEAFIGWLPLPASIMKATFSIPSSSWWREQHLKLIDMIIAVISIIVPAYWFAVRHQFDGAWIIQDFLGFFFCVNMLRTLRLPSLRICTYLLSILFLYDIFFVFITPLLTSKGKFPVYFLLINS